MYHVSCFLVTEKTAQLYHSMTLMTYQFKTLMIYVINCEHIM